MLYKDIHDVNGGFQGTTAACREYTSPREDPNSKITVWVEGHTKLDQFFKFKLDVVLTSLESKFRSHPHWETVENPGLLYPEAQSAAWRSYITVIQIALPGSLE